MLSKLIAVVGNSGVGKTTFAQQLCRASGLECAFEQHIERPFHTSFAQDLRRYALANQVDFLLFRAEQESAIRRSGKSAVVDGGLDQDFFVFTRHFHRKGFLTQGEFELCERLYRLLRQMLPPPDWIIYLKAPRQVIARRYAQRDRELEIAQIEDLEALELLLEEWLNAQKESPLLTLDSAAEDANYAKAVQIALREMQLI